MRLNRGGVKSGRIGTIKPSVYESEIYPSHKSDDLYSVYFALPGAVPPIGGCVRTRCLCTYSQKAHRCAASEKGAVYRKTFIFAE